MGKAVAIFLVLAIFCSLVVENEAGWFRRAWRRVRRAISNGWSWLRRNWDRLKKAIPVACRYICRYSNYNSRACTLCRKYGRNGKREMTDAHHQEIMKFVPLEDKEISLRSLKEPGSYDEFIDEGFYDSNQMDADDQMVERAIKENIYEDDDVDELTGRDLRAFLDEQDVEN